MTSRESESRPPASRGATRTPRVYPALDIISAGLIFFLIVATPWFFGTTENWSIWTMNIACYALGGLLAAKLAVRASRGFYPPRWEVETRGAGWFRRFFFGGNLLVLLFCLVAAVNARATFILFEQRFEYHESYVDWLPSSYDSHQSWFIFWQYLGLFFFFWALRDWLLGKSRRERHRSSGLSEPEAKATSPGRGTFLPDRLRWLLWVVCLNGAALAIVGILQKLDGTTQLLWMRDSYWGLADATFGPYAYRSNGAQFLNLVWPLAVGFWWMLKESGRRGGGKPFRVGEGPHLILIPAAILMALGSLISMSRGGAVIAGLNFLLLFLLLFFQPGMRWRTRWGLLILACAVASAAWFLGANRLAARFQALETQGFSGRMEIRENSQAIAEEFPVFGTGPGTFRSVYQMYRMEPGQIWQAWLHDDWFETRITFGWVGFGLVMLNLLVVVSAWLVRGGIPVPWFLPSSILVALAGCLVHAKFDFPLQTYSVLFTFILLCGILFCLAVRGGRATA